MSRFFMAMLNCADAADQNYVVSFVAGKPGLGLVSVKQIDSVELTNVIRVMEH